MTMMDVVKNVFRKKEAEVYTPQREHIDRRHDALQRQMSYYQKKREIPMMEAKIKQMEKEHFGTTMHTKDSNNILKVPNMIKTKNMYKWKQGGMLR